MAMPILVKAWTRSTGFSAIVRSRDCVDEHGHFLEASGAGSTEEQAIARAAAYLYELEQHCLARWQAQRFEASHGQAEFQPSALQRAS